MYPIFKNKINYILNYILNFENLYGMHINILFLIIKY